jgi:undecaprenyl-diphosphatase
METLLVLDHQLFFLVHNLPHALLLDWFALWLSGLGVAGLIWLLISIWLFMKIEKRDHWFFLPVVLAAALSELVTNMFLKNYFARARPPGAILTDYSFPSGHATFAWALAVVLAAKEPRARYFFYILAILISLSRVYLGVHYPADVVAGCIVGLTVGLLSLRIGRVVIQYRHAKIKRKRTSHYSRRRRGRKDD